MYNAISALWEGLQCCFAKERRVNVLHAYIQQRFPIIKCYAPSMVWYRTATVAESIVMIHASVFLHA